MTESSRPKKLDSSTTLIPASILKMIMALAKATSRFCESILYSIITHQSPLLPIPLLAPTPTPTKTPYAVYSVLSAHASNMSIWTRCSSAAVLVGRAVQGAGGQHGEADDGPRSDDLSVRAQHYSGGAEGAAVAGGTAWPGILLSHRSAIYGPRSVPHLFKFRGVLPTDGLGILCHHQIFQLSAKIRERCSATHDFICTFNDSRVVWKLKFGQVIGGTDQSVRFQYGFLSQ